MDLGNMNNSIGIAVDFFHEISPVIYLLLAVVLVPFLIDILISLLSPTAGLKTKEIEAEIKTYGRKLSRRERKMVNDYLEKQRYEEALKG
jgi:hypothetical protein